MGLLLSKPCDEVDTPQLLLKLVGPVLEAVQNGVLVAAVSSGSRRSRAGSGPTFCSISSFAWARCRSLSSCRRSISARSCRTCQGLMQASLGEFAARLSFRARGEGRGEDGSVQQMGAAGWVGLGGGKVVGCVCAGFRV